MTAPTAPVEAAAERLRVAARDQRACAPIRDLIDPADGASAYQVQQINVAAAVGDGRRVCGRKVGLTSPAVQQQLGVDRPDFGTLFADMAHPSGVEVPSGRLLQPRAEAEVALVLDGDLPDDEIAVHHLVRLTAFALPAIEIVDSRVRQWDITFADTVADNGSCGVFVLGNRPVPLAAFDMAEVAMVMTMNGEPASTGDAGQCLGNPLHAAVWLANTVARAGRPLRAGDVVLTGALGPMRPLRPGDEVHADLGVLGTVRTRLGEGA